MLTSGKGLRAAPAGGERWKGEGQDVAFVTALIPPVRAGPSGLLTSSRSHLSTVIRTVEFNMGFGEDDRQAVLASE